MPKSSRSWHVGRSVLARNVFSIAIGNLSSKGVALLREVAFAACFGTGEIASAYRIAQTAYLLPTQALIGDSLSAGLLPLYRQLRPDGADAPRLLLLISAFYGLLFSAVVTTLSYLYASYIVAFIAPGASSAALALAGSLLKILALSTPFYVMSGMLSYIETAYGRYGAIAWRPMLLNIGSIAGIGLAVLFRQDHWLATGILLSHIVFLIWTVTQLRQLDQFMPASKPAVPLVRAISARFLKNMLPLLGLPLIAQVNVLVERIVSSWLGTQVIPSVDYARFIADTTVQLIAVPLGVLTMSMHGGASPASMRAHVREVTAAIMLLTFPMAAFIGLNAESIVHLLFARGAFNAQSVATTTSVLRWMGGCLGTTVAAYYLVKALNAQLRNLVALSATVVACGANMLVNVGLWRYLGPQTVGAGVAAYSTVLFIICVTRLGFWRDLFTPGAWIAGGVVVQIATCTWISAHAVYPGVLIANGAATAAIWLALFALSRPLRRAASPVLSRVPVLKRLAVV